MMDVQQSLATCQGYQVEAGTSCLEPTHTPSLEDRDVGDPNLGYDVSFSRVLKPESSVASPSCSPLTNSVISSPTLVSSQASSNKTYLRQQIIQLILNNTDPEITLKKIASQLIEAFQVNHCILGIRENQQAKLQIIGISAHCSAPPNSHLTAILEYPALETLLVSPEPVVVADTQAPSLGFENSPVAALISTCQSLKAQWPFLQAGAVLGQTTSSQGQVNGVISLIKSQPYLWSREDIQLLEDISGQVAVAIAQAQLQRQLHQQAQHQALIDRLTMAIHSSSELNQILQIGAEGTAEALQVDRSMVVLLKYSDPLFKSRSQTQIPRIRATVVCEWRSSCSQLSYPETQEPKAFNPPHDINTLVNYSFWMSECEFYQQLSTNAYNILVISDQHPHALNDPTLGLGSLLNPEAMPAFLLAPLISQGTILGFLLLQQHQPRTWQPEELKLVELVSAHLSTAVIQTQTLRQVQALVEERTAQLKRSLEVQAKLYEKTRQQIDQLRHLNEVKDEFLSTVSHELRTPLTSMTLAIRMLRQPGLSEERRAKYLDILEAQCSQETNLINDLLTLQQLESKQVSINIERIDLKQLIGEVLQPLEPQWVERGLSLEVDLPNHSLTLQSDAESLKRILLELLTNASKYSESGTTVRLKAVYQSEPQLNPAQLVLTVSNLGSGISPTELPQIFDKFRRGQGVTQNAIQGTGLGLALVKSLVQHLNGNVTAASYPLEGTAVFETLLTLTLPQISMPSEL